MRCRFTTAPGGFSLVEVTLAIGIVAFAFVALLGLLPVGLTSFRSALDRSVRSQIVQSLTTQAQQTDFALLKANTTSILSYYDDEGAEVPAESSIYTASMKVAPKTELPEAGESTNVLTLNISIANNPGHLPDPFKPGLAFSKHAAFVARNR